MNNRKKMYLTNMAIRKYLTDMGFKELYFFPHLRFSKDYHLFKESFDALGIKGSDIWLLQFKTNKKPSKKTLMTYQNIENAISVKLGWVNKVKKEITLYTAPPKEL